MCLLNTDFTIKEVPCYSLKYLNSAPVSLPAKSTPRWGQTKAQVGQFFAYNILLNFETNANLDSMVTGMDNFMIARLSTELAANDVSGYTYSIMMYAGEKLSAANLHRVQAAFGPTEFAIAFKYAPAAIQAQYNATAMVEPLPLSEYWQILGQGTGGAGAGYCGPGYPGAADS
jgi:hypothetical protein